ncbi:MAG: 30S ribosomal protein S12 methylthiotransferase RimO [Desulfonatronovibrionaceae bacterium]
MQKLKIYTLSLGCPKNRVDTEKILGGLGEAWEPANKPERADLVLVNTCAFIAPAVEESLQEIIALGEVIKGRGKKTRPLLAVTGCLVARYGRKKLYSLLPEVDWFVDIPRQAELCSLVRERFKLQTVEKEQVLTTGPGYGYVMLSDGCNKKCSFCTIPSLRGRLRSRPREQIAKDAQALLDQGAKELVLVAQDTTAYGRDLGEKDGLVRVLDRLLRLTGLKRLRLMYMYPSGITRELLDFMAWAGERMLPYFDVPLQHADPHILRRMGRPFALDPQEVVDLIRGRVPGAALRTTMIVGFPGEKPRHFDRLIAFAARNRFHSLGAFPYYPEEGTRAAGFPEQVKSKEKQKRLEELMAVQRSISTEHLRDYEDREVEVLVDEPHPEWPGLHTGRTWFQAPEVDGITYISGPDVIPGKILRAIVQEAKDYDLVAMT